MNSTVMAVLVGTAALVALGYILYGAWMTAYSLEEGAAQTFHIHAHHTGNLAPHH